MELSYAPMTPFMEERVPGMTPLDMSGWLHRDEAFAAQMAYRDRLVAEVPDVVLKGEGGGGADELLSLVLDLLSRTDGYVVEAGAVARPDGVRVAVNRDAPFATLARLVQEDLLILSKPEGAAEHVLIGGALLFPSRWSFEEKMGRPLIGIHDRVPAYDRDLALRVQRLFDMLRPGRPLVRANWLVHPEAELHQPKLYATSKKPHVETGRFWLRVERQSLVKLPASGASVFSVKTFITPIEALTAEERGGLIAALDRQTNEMRDYHGGVAHNDAALAALAALA
ncbi:MAG: DUF3445 domain-containing protein [Pseudomonadota bacterium]